LKVPSEISIKRLLDEGLSEYAADEITKSG